MGLSSGGAHVHRALAEQLLSVDDFLSFKAMGSTGEARGNHRGSTEEPGKNMGKMSEFMNDL